MTNTAILEDNTYIWVVAATWLQKLINDLPAATATRLEDAGLTVVALADLKNEIKENGAAYSDSELKMMKQLFLAGCDAYKIPRESLSLSLWYISRSGVHFDHTNPFTTGQFHSLHYGTLDSGARVAVNIVNADVQDAKTRDRFVREVNTLNVVSDFMFVFVRASSVLNLKTKPTTYDWTAPECLGLGPESNPRFESDVYSLGLCLIEAVTGKRPFEGFTANDEDTRAEIRAGRLPNWSASYNIPPAVDQLVAKMCAYNFTDRLRLSDVVQFLEVLAAQEHVAQEASLCTCAAPLCRQCGKPSHKPTP